MQRRAMTSLAAQALREFRDRCALKSLDLRLFHGFLLVKYINQMNDALSITGPR